MATLADPGKYFTPTISFNYQSGIVVESGASTLTPTTQMLVGSIQIVAGSRLKIVAAEYTSDGTNLIAAPVVQYWG
jgi:hypothetical protein